MIYRALRDLGLGKRTIRSGDIFSSELIKPDNLATLEQQGKVAPANLPPIAAMPRWKSKRAALSKIGVETAGDFLEMDSGALAKALKSTEAEIKQAKAEMTAQFNIPRPKN